jgi:N-acetylmuramic acid 6-phosphate etherase
VIALVAGGARALRRAVEGAEDDADAGRRDVRRARVGAPDLVVGISASGTTPYVVAALGEARSRGATAGLVTSNPSARPAGVTRVVLETGPELVAGSTRMKAGSAAKMALSLLSTAAMLRLGKVLDGRMVDLTPTSSKLRRRATRIVMELSRATAAEAEGALEASGWRVRAALQALGWGATTRAGAGAGRGARSGARAGSRSRSRSTPGARSRSGAGG